MREMRSQGAVLSKVVAVLILLVGLVVYLFSVEENPITGERQRVAINPQQEVMLGREARGHLAEQFGGILADGTVANRTVDEVGETLVEALRTGYSADGKTLPYQFEFHVLADDATVNALALPGGQIFITSGLLAQLQDNDQLAAVLSHEIGHVIHRHAAQRMAKAQLKAQLTAAIEVATEEEDSAAPIEWVGGLLALRYSRQQELESDRWGLELMSRAGYHREAMLELLEILQQTGGRSGPEFLQTHPHAETRRQAIQEMLNREAA